MSIILVHGSVETSTAPEYILGLEVAAMKGYDVLDETNDRIKSIETTINELEDNPLFNAGLGSVLNRDGQVEVDGSIMDGVSERFAAVASMRDIRHAVSVAIRVMEKSKHVILAGEGATLFAREQGFPFDNCITEEQLKLWMTAKKLYNEGKQLEFSAFTGRIKESDTVGCVLMDSSGQLVAASSTGGSFLKHPGRVGDTPFIGGGILATEHCAVVCTGRGEAFIQTLTAKFVEDCVKNGDHPQDAAIKGIRRLYDKTGEFGGILVLDHKGRIAAVHNCNMFPVSLVVDGEIIKIQPTQLHFADKCLNS